MVAHGRVVARIGWRGVAGGVLAVALVAGFGVLTAAAHRDGGRPAARLGGCSIFPPYLGRANARGVGNESAWNQDISRAPKDPRSSAYVNRITSLGGNQVIAPSFGGKGRWGIPYTTVGPHTRKVPVSVSPFGEDFGRAPIPPRARVQDGDGHVLVLQRGTCKLYEMFSARYLGGKGHRWHAGATARFNLKSRKHRREGSGSADAAGLPILPGLVRYGDIKRGVIRHAIRVTFAETREAYIHPATHYASSSCDRNLPPMGLRLRLSHGYFKRNLHRFPRGSQSRIIFVALYHYGIIAADNASPGAGWMISGANARRWHDDDLNRLTTVPGTAFVVVKSGKVHTPC